MDFPVEALARVALGWSQFQEGLDARLEARFSHQDSCMDKLQQMVDRLVSTLSGKGSRTGDPRVETGGGDEGEFGGNVQTESRSAKLYNCEALICSSCGAGGSAPRRGAWPAPNSGGAKVV